MQIAIASGKGGTGKTTVAVNLAQAMSRQQPAIVYCDCDVEAPNGHVFLKPEIADRRTASVPVPKVNEALCTGCGECGRFCRFSAIVVIRGKVLTYPELCHGCGGCRMICEAGAIEEIHREIGVVESGSTGNLGYVAGRLNIGEASAVPLIRQVKANLPEDGITVVDAPPGASCPTIEAVKDASHVILVAEPTPFGLNDLQIAVDTVREIGIAFSIVINRSDIGDDRVEEYCRHENIEILARIPYSRSIAEAYSRGRMMVGHLPGQSKLYSELAERIEMLTSPAAEAAS